MEEENKTEEENIVMTFTPAEKDDAALPLTDEQKKGDATDPEDEQPISDMGSAERSIEQLKKFTEEDEDLYSATKTLRSILGGDFLTEELVRRQVPLIILIAACFFVHISFRNTNQKEEVEIDKLKRQVEDVRFNALTRFSELTAKSRQSYIEQFLQQHNDSSLQTATHPPYIIHLSGDNGDFTSLKENDEGKDSIEEQ